MHSFFKKYSKITSRPLAAQKCDSPRPAEEHPPSRLTQAAAAEVAAGVYLGQVTLDVNLYREAKAASALSDKERQSQYESAKAQQTRDVRACQNYFQLSEFVIDASAWLPSIAQAGKWLSVCTGAARANSQKLRQHLRVEASEVATINIVSLNNMGPLRTQVVQKLQQELPHFDGVTLVVHPVVPRKAFSRTIDSVEQDADDTATIGDDSASGDATGDEMSDVDEGAAIGASNSFPYLVPLFPEVTLSHEVTLTPEVTLSPEFTPRPRGYPSPPRLPLSPRWPLSPR